MVATIDIKEHMEVIGADGAFVGKVDKIEGERIKLTKDDGHGGKRDHHHFLPMGLVADIEGDKVRLSATAANALTFQEEETGTIVAGEPTGSAQSSAFGFSGQSGGDIAGTQGTGGQADTKPGTQPVRSADETQKAVPVPSVPTYKEAAKPSRSKSIGVGAALGAAALGAAALGAAKLIKNRDAESDAIPLDDDESRRLISSSKVEGTKVVDRDGTAIGTIQNFMVDKYTGHVAYAVLSFGGTFGFGATLFPLPWGALEYDVENDAYALGITKDQLAQAPKFEARDTPEFDVGYRQRIVLFYRGM